MMKKILMLLMSALVATSAWAAGDDATLEKIESANKKINTLQANFSHIKCLNKKETKREGTLYFAVDKLSMVFSQPAADRFVIANGSMMVKDGKKGVKKYDLSKVKTMKSLSDCLLWAMHGEVRKIAKANDAEIAITENGNSYIITLTAKKKQVKGYTKIVIEYIKKNGAIQRMVMEDAAHTVNTYELSGSKPNATLPSDCFDF